MNTLVTMTAAAGLAMSLSSVAFAGDRLNDAQYIKASRCRAIATSNTFGPIDPRDIDAYLQGQAIGRSDTIAMMARDAQIHARHQAVDPKQQPRLAKELDTDCRSYLQQMTVASRK